MALSVFGSDRGRLSELGSKRGQFGAGTNGGLFAQVCVDSVTRAGMKRGLIAQVCVESVTRALPALTDLLFIGKYYR